MSQRDGSTRESPGPKIREARKRAGLTQAQLAVKLGVGQAMVSLVENGHEPVSLDILLDYAEAEGIPHEDWYWSVVTGERAGSNYSTWRLVDRDIPRDDWLRIDRLDGVDDAGFRWVPIQQDTFGR